MKTLMNEIKYDSAKIDELENIYDQALQNENFKELVMQLNMPRKKLIQYTSSLEDSVEEYNHCKYCKGLLECQNQILGYAYLPHVVDDNLLFEYQACKYRIQKEQNFKYQKNMELFEIPNELMKASLKDIDTTDKNRYPAIKWLQNFIQTYDQNKNQKGLYLHGSFGSGKSYFIVAAFSELARKNVKSALVFWPEFLRELKASFKTDFKEKYDTIKKAPLLLIDDIGAEVTTEWGRDEIFCPLIQYRMDAKLPTFFTSNLDLSMLEEHFSCSKNKTDRVKARRIIERMMQLTDQIEMVSKNRR